MDEAMKKSYICPATAFEEAQATEMLAESLYIINESVDGSYAFVKTNNSWDIWGEEEEPR